MENGPVLRFNHRKTFIPLIILFFDAARRGIYVTFHAKRGLMGFIVNREINFTVTAREFDISRREISISRRVHYCSNSFHYAE